MHRYVVVLLFVCWSEWAAGQTIQDASFEGFDVPDGSSVTAPGGPWSWNNDAGVVDPFLPNRSDGANQNTASGTLEPVDGQQYATTYATLDSIRQPVEFPRAGDYELSVWAAAPSGTLTIPGVFTDRPLEPGGFQFEFDRVPIGELQALDPGTPWTLFTATVTVPSPGLHELGVRNVVTAPYFVNYDQFSLAPIPEPSTAMLCTMLVALGAGLGARRRTNGSRWSWSEH